MSNYWATMNPHTYRQMRARHQDLWKSICKYIEASEVTSVLEVGPGMFSPAKDMVKEYYAVDVNPRVEGLVADFTKANLALLPEADLLLACGVIEHCESYEPFFHQAILYNAPTTIITFFRKVCWKRNYIKIGRRGFYNNKYSRTKMDEWLRARNVNPEWIHLAKYNDILTWEGK